MFGNLLSQSHPVVSFKRLIAHIEWENKDRKKLVRRGTAISIFIIVCTFLLALIFLSMSRSKIIISGAVKPPSIVEMVAANYKSILPLGSIFSSSEEIYSSGFWLSAILASILVFFCLSGESLIREMRKVTNICSNPLSESRQQVKRIFGRDVSSLSEQEVRDFAIKSLAKNMLKIVIAPLFWYILLGVPGMLTYKMISMLYLTIKEPFIGTSGRTLTNKDVERAIKKARYTETSAIVICIITLYLMFIVA